MAAGHALHLSLILLSLACAVVADDDNLWIYPTAPGPSNNFKADQVWSLGSEQTIEWTTTLSSYYIALFQQQIEPPSGIQIDTIYRTNTNGSGDKSFKWTVQTYDANATKSPVYFFWVNPGSPAGFTSHYFNITSAAATTSSATSQSTTSSSKPSSTPPASDTATSAKPTNTSPLPASTSSTTSAAEKSTSSSSGPDISVIRVALGVGLGLGIPLVLFIGIWIGLKAVRQRRAASRNSVAPRGGEEGGWPMAPFPREVEQKSTPVVEAPFFHTRAEAPDSNYWSPHGMVHEAPGDPPLPAELDSGHVAKRWRDNTYS